MTVYPADLTMPPGKVAFFRSVPNSYADATTLAVNKGAIDVALARKQHKIYCQEVIRLGYKPVLIPRDDASADSVFIEDIATAAGGIVLLHQSAHPGRRSEATGLRRTLSAFTELDVTVVEMSGTAFADGGDVLRIGSTLFVGLSQRTTRDGVAAIRRAFEPGGFTVRAVELPPGVLHLKCICSMADAEHLILAEDTVPHSVFSDYASIIQIPFEEQYAANVVGAAGRVIVPDGFPETVSRVAAHGFEVRVLDTSEFRKGDGSLTCLSILLDTVSSK